jgi:hypothetical protein
MINNDFPSLYGTFEQQAMVAFSMNQQLLTPQSNQLGLGGMVGDLSGYDDHAQAVKLAAQAALEVFHYDSDMELDLKQALPVKEESPIGADEETLDGGIEEDLVVQTVKGRYMCPRPNCSKVLMIDLALQE